MSFLTIGPRDSATHPVHPTLTLLMPRVCTLACTVLKAAAKAMRHKESTQQSDRYDKASHDRLTAAATGFLERYVASLSEAGGSGAGADALDEWETLEPRTSHRFTPVGDLRVVEEWGE